MSEIFATTPWLLITTVFIFSLLVGSFLNVVIHRLPIMLEREWMAQAHEMLAGAASQDVAREDAVEPHPPMPPDEVVVELGGCRKPDQQKPTPSRSLLNRTRSLDQITDDAADNLLSTEPIPLPALEGAQPDEAPDRPRRRALQPDRPPLPLPEVQRRDQGAPEHPGDQLPASRRQMRQLQDQHLRALSDRGTRTAILSAAVAWRFGWHWQTLAALFFTWALVALTVIDLDHTILPDAITIPLLWLGLLLSLAWHAGLAPPAPTDPTSAIVGAAAGYLLLWSVYWAFKLATGKEGMGYGDFKLFGALGRLDGLADAATDPAALGIHGRGRRHRADRAARSRPQHPAAVRPVPRGRRLDRIDVGAADRRRLSAILGMKP